MMYGQSQKDNYFQVAFSRTLQQFGIEEQGLASLRNLGIAAHPRTVQAEAKLSASIHLDNVNIFFEEAIANKQLVVMFIDDYHNIHAKHRPDSNTRTQAAVHMVTLLVKVFPGISAIEKEGAPSPINPNAADVVILSKILKENMTSLSKSYACAMPDWARAKYFDPEAERNRLCE